ncbi:Cell division protein FtsI/penicillin-binding protein 2 [Paenibacillus sp. UNCCL117]|uniref:peptidoglycan D,D-transpeptidase FtsI family protein n=1 Tax=unclassified Paenibacillus TaxID=185978 RepID=UPI00088C034C|nr:MULTISPECIES: penicillin-binding transpeptidase domain-containing protein [unclassified Paenibacillus]SDD01200.1 Cell division protein FtsI/penicillin-binding protein 2 [Paenibacillus sp. cl123]SFW32725.1 Cell division protein FtsI/penicillin-binding protein 2 [Paenibacillus sp. UNCCL117]
MRETSGLKKNRIFVILIVTVGVLIVWNIRLFWIQIAASGRWTWRHIDLVENSVVQREQGIVLDSGRGDFVDRHGKPLTGAPVRVLTVFPIQTEPQREEARERLIAEAARILQVTKSALKSFQQSSSSPRMWPGQDAKPLALSTEQAEKLAALGLEDFRVTTYKQRYETHQPASRLIGYIGQNPERIIRQFTDLFHKGELQLTSRIGNAGLEKSFEPWLRGIGPTTVSLFTDAGKRPLPGLDIREISPRNPYYPLRVVTTLDRGIQERIEQKLERSAVREGTVVVLDIETADVVAMASKPFFTPDHVDPSRTNWSNLALQAEAPGSIFKTVTAIAALEEGVVKPGETFHCRGELGQFGFRCWKHGGHGELTLEEGFAQSCNIVFAQVAQRLGGELLAQYAERLGASGTVGWSGAASVSGHFLQWDGEQRGQTYAASTDRSDPGALVQTAIGQRDVQMTPLQAANLVVTLYHGGRVQAPRIVKEVRFANGRLYEQFAPHEAELMSGGKVRLHAKTAETLLEWMDGVVDHGTGRALQAAKWPLAGKSGTAQIVLDGGQAGENHWFIGYGPADAPRYAAAVLIRHVPEGGPNRSIELFREVMDVLADQER